MAIYTPIYDDDEGMGADLDAKRAQSKGKVSRKTQSQERAEVQVQTQAPTQRYHPLLRDILDQITSIKSCGALPHDPWVTLTYDQLPAWAERHGLARLPYTEQELSDRVARLGRNAYASRDWDRRTLPLAFAPDDGNYPVYDPQLLTAGARSSGILPVGVIPAATHMRVTTTNRVRRSLVGTLWDDYINPESWVGVTSTWWWGFDPGQTAVSCAHASDLFLHFGDFTNRRDSSNVTEDYFEKIKRGCLKLPLIASERSYKVPRRTRPTILSVLGQSVLHGETKNALKSTVLALPGNYPPPPPVEYELARNLIAAHRAGVIEMAGVLPKDNRRKIYPDKLTGIRVWPVQRHDNDDRRDSYAFYYSGETVVGVCPLRLYGVLAEPITSADKERCESSGGMFGKFTTILLTGVLPIAAGFIGGPGVAQAARAITGAFMQGGASGALDAALSIGAPALASAVGGAFNELGARSFMKEIATAIPRFNPSSIKQLGSDAIKNLAVGDALPIVNELTEKARGIGIPVDVAQKAIATQIDQIQKVAVQGLQLTDTTRWTRAVNEYIQGIPDATATFTGENSFSVLSALQAGSQHPLSRDPSVAKAAALSITPDPARSGFTRRDALAPFGSVCFLENAALDCFSGRSSAMNTAVSAAYELRTVSFQQRVLQESGVITAKAEIDALLAAAPELRGPLPPGQRACPDGFAVHVLERRGDPRTGELLRWKCIYLRRDASRIQNEAIMLQWLNRLAKQQQQPTGGGGVLALAAAAVAAMLALK